MREIVFVGGIHGVGKGNLCQKICDSIDFEHLVASQLIKWHELSNAENKEVQDIPETQLRLIRGLEKLTNPNQRYLLDGHFCLFNSTRSVERVPINTFQEIKPKSILVVTEKIDVIIERLTQRDNRTYQFAELDLMQKEEIDHASKVSTKLGIPFLNASNQDLKAILEFLR